MHEAARKMIDAAERLAAERGLAALTVQAVQTAAGQRNKSAVQYHFGGRQELVNALLAERMSVTTERRTAMLLELDGEVGVRDLVEILILPLVESVQSRSPSYWARFLLQALSDPSTGIEALGATGDRALSLTHDKLVDLLDHLPPAIRRMRVQNAFGYACLVLAGYEVGFLPPEIDGAALGTELVDACCGLLAAPSTVR